MITRRSFSSPPASISKGDDETEDYHYKFREPVSRPNVVEASFGKRKFTEKDDAANELALAKLEMLLLDDDDDDILLLDPDTEDGVLLELGSAATIEVKEKETDEKSDAGGASQAGNDDDQSKCQMKWLRTVGLSQNGSLQCTVTSGTAGLDNGSESGQTPAESVVADTIRGMIAIYHKKRPDVLDQGIVATPLHVVKKLALQHGETLHCEVLSNPNGYNRVEIFSGIVRGVGEGTTKRIAAQMAAIDLLERVQLSGGTVKVPSVAFLPGWLTSNRVFTDLVSLCKEKGLPRPKFTAKTNNLTADGKVDHFLPPFQAECWIADEYVTIGKSENETFAKREAAKEMFAVLANVEYKDTPYAIGSSCRRALDLAATGYPLVMSDYKKMWLLQNRVCNNQIVIPKDEAGLEDIAAIEELEKDIVNVDKMGYDLLKKKKNIKVTVKNKKMKLGENGGDEAPEPTDENRQVVVEQKKNVEEEDSWY